MKKLLLLLMLFGALPLFGQGTSFPVFNRQGWTMAGAVVSVCNGPADPGTSNLPCVGSQTTTYTDWTLSVACTLQTSIPNPPGPPLGPTHGVGCTNPGLTDSHGNATIFAANGFYWAQIAGYQVVPQTFPFNIGSGGGGGGLIPCGVINDVQLYGTSTNLGCDSGILIGNPSTHTLSDNIINGNQQVQVGDTTHSGKVCYGHSNGSSIDANECESLSPTFNLTGGGYNWYRPDTPLVGCLQITSLTPDSNGYLPTSWGTCGGGGGAVSLEYEYPLDFTNAPSPTTSTDLVRTLFPQAGSSVFMGPPPFTNPLSAYVQSAKCGANTVTTISCSLLSPVIPGDAIFVVGDTICGFGCFMSFTFTDSNSNSYTALNTQTNPNFTPMSDAVALNAKGGLTTVTMTLSSPGEGDNFGTNFVVVELNGVGTLDANSESGVTWATPGSPTSLSPITTSNSVDVIISTAQSYLGSPNNYTAGTGYDIATELVTNDSSGNFDSLGVQLSGVSTTSTYTPTIIGTQQPTGGAAGDSFSVALKYTGSLTARPPYFRNPTLNDQVTQGWFPDPTSKSGKCLSNNGTLTDGSLEWIACGSGGGDTITSPNSTLTVGGSSSATTLDVVGAAGKMLAGATPALTYNPILGVDGSNAGTLQLANNGSPFHTIIGTQASANWTLKLPATAGVNQYVLQTDGSGNTSWVAQTSGGDSITSPHSTIALGGTSSATTMDLAGVAGKIMAGATPALTFTPQLGVDNTNAGTLALANGSAIAHTILGSAATTTNTILGPAVVIPNGHLLECSTSSTTCTLTDGGAPATGTVTSSGSPVSGNIAEFTTATNIAPATVQGNGAKVQLSTGSTTTNDCVKFDANGNTVDAGGACGSGSGGGIGYASDTGSVNALATCPSGYTSSLTTGLLVSTTPAFISTSTSPTLNLCAGGGVSVKVSGGSPALGALSTTVPAVFEYDGTFWNLINPAAVNFCIQSSEIAPVSGDQIQVLYDPNNIITVTSVSGYTSAATSAVFDLKPTTHPINNGSFSAGTLGSSILSGTVTATNGTAVTGTISTPALPANTPLMAVVGTVTGTVGQLYINVCGARLQ